MQLGSPTKLEIKPNAGKTEFRFLLTFPELQKPVEFFVDSDSMMSIMVGLQRLQALHKIPIPNHVRPRGKPNLRVVTDDD